MKKEAKILKLPHVNQDTYINQNNASKLLKIYYQELLNLESIISDVVCEKTIQTSKGVDGMS